MVSGVMLLVNFGSGAAALLGCKVVLVLGAGRVDVHALLH